MSTPEKNRMAPIEPRKRNIPIRVGYGRRRWPNVWRLLDHGEFSGVEEGMDISVRPSRLRMAERYGVNGLCGRCRGFEVREILDRSMSVRVVRPTRAVSVVVSMAMI